jgi:hypothetical protein
MWSYAQFFKLNGETGHISAVNYSVYKRISVALVFYSISLLLAYWNTFVAFITLITPPLIHIFPGNVDKLIKKEVEVTH